VPAVTLRQLLEAGVHFGHQTSRWNPKMRPYIYAARNGIHIIDLLQTQKGLDAACDFVRDLVANGEKILFVGTKKQAQDIIEESCRRTGMPYVTHRWMGGMLTNFAVIQRQLRRMAELREMRDRGDFLRMGTKEANALADELERLERNFGGMAEMRRLPGALFAVDCRKERLAVTEANKLGIPVVAIVDSNCDPEKVQYVIPGNDDAIRSIRLVVHTITEAILEGQRLYAERELREQAEPAAEAQRAAREAAGAAESDAGAGAEESQGVQPSAAEAGAGTSTAIPAEGADSTGVASATAGGEVASDGPAASMPVVAGGDVAEALAESTGEPSPSALADAEPVSATVDEGGPAAAIEAATNEEV
jgi:small subunit ribosomal protein S2